MDIDEQRQMLESTLRELQDAERRVVYLRQVVDGLQGLLYPRTETGSIELSPAFRVLMGDARENENMSARNAVETVLHRNPNRGLTSRQVYQLVLDYGLINADFTSGQAAYDTALRRLAAEQSSFVLRDEATATFIYRPDDQWFVPNESWSSVRGQMHNAELRAYEQEQSRHTGSAFGGS